ncbi:hypothetical protein OK016_23885 [Vibrio chagasii]|nr:hypothetical protein [Vibrio chagasii]
MLANHTFSMLAGQGHQLSIIYRDGKVVTPKTEQCALETMAFQRFVDGELLSLLSVVSSKKRLCFFLHCCCIFLLITLGFLSLFTILTDGY